jgi:hypothetical protein
MSKILLVLMYAIAFGAPQALQPIKAQAATAAIIEAFNKHDIVMSANGTLINRNTNGYVN